MSSGNNFYYGRYWIPHRFYGKLCSFEALARWEDPVYGLITPDKFIPVLERSHKIHLLDICIIRQVCARMRKTSDAGLTPVPVSVNLSKLDFTMCDIFSIVDDIVTEYQIPHDFIYIEITESMTAEHEDLMKTIMNKFQQRGYQVWMDDFGSAYSSLNVLKDFFFQELKLDMRFLSAFHQRSRRILTAVIQMAKEIEIHTLAEGVETEEQFRYLRNIGCEKVQGFYFGKPLPYEKAMTHLQDIGISLEMPQDRKYYDDIGNVNLLSAVPFMTREERNALTTARKLYTLFERITLIDTEKDTISSLYVSTREDPVSGRRNVHLPSSAPGKLC
ncbi:MAG: EAL domain-containing protein [Eubacterium sp.]|nr:EAL domain-containing protein [Eubacterium sp.]